LATLGESKWSWEERKKPPLARWRKSNRRKEIVIRFRPSEKGEFNMASNLGILGKRKAKEKSPSRSELGTCDAGQF